MKSITAVFIGMVAVAALAGCRKAVQPSGGMSPTIKPGEQVTINYLAYVAAVPGRWDVVALEPPSSTNLVVLKRVFALPGETISLATNGVLINGSPIKLPPALSNSASFPLSNLPLQGAGGVTFPFKVPPKQYFVIGDNWANSLDSRQYGAVPVGNILGKVPNK